VNGIETKELFRVGRPRSPASMLVKNILNRVGNPPVRVILWDGTVIAPPGDPPEFSVRFRTQSALLHLFLDPEAYFGEGYASGLIEIEGDLVRFLEMVYLSLSGIKIRPIWALFPRRARNNQSRSLQNIHSHYDIGNAFYRLWLDREMLYTCAYFPQPGMSLEAAQTAKMDYVCRKLQLKAGEEVVEAGCGWGSLALHMAKYYGVRVKAYNISREQVSHARKRAAEEGFGGRVEFVEEDYRKIRGQFDAFVSVGMLEHVGPENYQELGGVIDGCLKANGRGLVHTIGRNSPATLSEWVEQKIFPGAYPPTLKEMMAVFEPSSFSICDIENLRLHYWKTIEHWLSRFDSAEETLNRMFDPFFTRAWRLYLAGSLVAFKTGTLQLFQVVFTRHRNNEIPWSRDYLYGKV
jgi:cyclopropane-fatty-acyl-phospholipid synthase